MGPSASLQHLKLPRGTSGPPPLHLPAQGTGGRECISNVLRNAGPGQAQGRRGTCVLTELQFPICGLLDSRSGLLMKWGAPPGLRVPVETLPLGKALEAICLLSPSYLTPTSAALPRLAPARPDRLRTRFPASFLGRLILKKWVVELRYRIPRPTSAPSRVPTAALHISHCNHPAHEAAVAILQLLLAGQRARGPRKRTSCGGWIPALG